MPQKVLTRSAMDIMQGLVDRFNELVLADNAGSLSVDEVGVVIAFMTATLMAVMERGADLNLLGKIVEELEPFRFRHVAGADLGRRYGGCVPDAEVRVDSLERETRNALDNQVHRFTHYQYCLEWALTDVKKLSVAQQTKEQLRSTFLRHVAGHRLANGVKLNIASDLKLQQSFG